MRSTAGGSWATESSETVTSQPRSADAITPILDFDAEEGGAAPGASLRRLSSQSQGLRHNFSESFHAFEEDVLQGARRLTDGVVSLEHRLVRKAMSAEHSLESGVHKLSGDLQRIALVLFKGEEVDLLALRLMRGHCVFSQDWRADLWLHLKNKQIFLSMFLCHPKHPFSRSERRLAFFVSCVLAFGLETWFCNLWTSCEAHPNLNVVEFFVRVMVLKIAVSALVNGLYDAILEFAMTCPCVQTGVPDWYRASCEALSVVQLTLQLCGGALVLFAGLYYLATVSHARLGNGFWWDVGICVRELFIGKAVGLFVVTLLIETLGFLFGRKRQMKPDPDEVARLEVWDAPSQAAFPFCWGGEHLVGEPPSAVWNATIGPGKFFTDLPRLPPTYDVEARVGCYVVYRESASRPDAIPAWFKSDLTQPPSRIEKWLRSDSDPRLVGFEHTWRPVSPAPMPRRMPRHSQVAPGQKSDARAGESGDGTGDDGCVSGA